MRLSGIRYLLFMLLLAPVACSDEEALPDAPDTPEEPVQIYRPLLAYNTLRTEEKLDSDAQTVTARQTFSCTDGLLTQMVYEQSFTAVEPVTMTQTTTLTYLTDKVIVTANLAGRFLPVGSKQNKIIELHKKLHKKKVQTKKQIRL